MNFLYQSSSLYLPITACSIESLIKYNDVEKIYVILSEEFEHNSKLLKDQFENRITIKTVDGSKFDKKCEELGLRKFRDSYSTYHKMFFFDELNEEGIVYLDGDTLINDKINVIMKESLLYGCYDCVSEWHLKNINFNINDKYINCGVLFVNIKKWKELNATETICSYVKNDSHYFPLADQDIINQLFTNEIEIIDPRYNYNSGYDIFGIEDSFYLYNIKNRNYYSLDKLKNSSKKVAVYHCMGAATKRPWETNNFHPQKELFKQYENFLSKDLRYILEESRGSGSYSMQTRLFKYCPRNLYLVLHKMSLFIYSLKEKRRKHK